MMYLCYNETVKKTLTLFTILFSFFIKTLFANSGTHILSLHQYYLNHKYQIQGIPLNITSIVLEENAIIVDASYASKLSLSSLSYFETNIKNEINKSLEFLSTSPNLITYRINFKEKLEVLD